ncbi:prefoldin subunit beta [Candidatus Woesearchaeota archaeon]|nr:prefoldin subunit beta [Candidatus Woesearchaeota archaeon]
MTDREQDINQLQLYEQSLQNILMQKQQFQTQIAEIESALKELKDSEESYRIIGNIMVKSKKPDVRKDLESKKATSELRIKTLEKQEENIREKAQSLQSEIMKNMEGSKNAAGKPD